MAAIEYQYTIEKKCKRDSMLLTLFLPNQ